MRLRFTAMLAALALVLGASSAWAQSQTGDITGKVTDESGAVLPGVTVTLTGPVLLQPQTAVTSDTGTFQFPRLDIGSYNIKFELTGFKTIIKQNNQVQVNTTTTVNTQLGVSAVQETVTVSGESPIVDTKQTGTKQTFTLEQLQNIPSARDPWVILQQTAGIAMDRENIGGNMSGQQSNFVSRGANPTNTKWSLDGIDTTDMAATGASPTYYDFDAFQQIGVSTGGVDVTQQTGGVGINLVTKSGTDRFKGSARLFDTNSATEANNVTDAMRLQGATSGNPIQDVKDYGVEAGGPIKKGRAWVWGSYGKQNIKVGVLNFYKPDASCQAFKTTATALAASLSAVNDCLNTDLTVLKSTNLKGEVELFKGNKLTLFNSMSSKTRNARGADDLHPIETTNVQAAVPSTFGTNYWITGPSPTYKFGDQYVLSDRLLVDAQYSHVGNNFILDFHDPSLSTVEPILIVNSTLNGRSGSESVNIRPVNAFNVNSNYFLPSFMGMDHSFKFGAYWRNSQSDTISHVGGNATARFPTQADFDNDTCVNASAGCAVSLTRDGNSLNRLVNVAAYAQDSIVKGKATIQLGLRYDYNHDMALAATIPASPLVPTLLPTVSFGGVDPGIKFNNFSPRLGLTYDLSGNGQTILKTNYARYYGQVGNGAISGQVNPLSSVTVRYPWTDLNGDRVVQANEVFPTGGNFANFQALTGNWDPSNPSSPSTKNTIDPNLKNDTTDEVIVGASHELGHGLAVEADYIYRYYGNFNNTYTYNTDPTLLTSADYLSRGTFVPSSSYLSTTYQPVCTVANARCTAVTAFYPSAQLGAVTELRNVPNFNRQFNGVELSGRKRMSHHWSLDTSFTYNSTIQNYGDGSFQNPNNIAQHNGAQVPITPPAARASATCSSTRAGSTS